MSNLIIYATIFPASVLSGMLGIGVAFAAIPILEITDLDLVHGVQPFALLLNGVTALFSAIAFGRAGQIDWPTSFGLSAVATLFAPLGALAAQSTQAGVLWVIYFVALAAVVHMLLAKPKAARAAWPTGQILAAGAPVSALSGLLGVGPGVLMVALMVYAGFNPRRAAAVNAVAVIPSSFAALAPHLGRASIDFGFVAPVLISAAAGALLGGYLSCRRVSEPVLRGLFIGIIIALALYKGITLLPNEPIVHGSAECWEATLRLVTFTDCR